MTVIRQGTRVYPRTERFLTFVAFFASVAIVVVGTIKLDQRRNEHRAAAPAPSSAFTATPLASPPATSRAAASASSPRPRATESAPPPPTPTAPPVAVATPFVRPPGASPMPHTGGGAVPQGLLLVAGAALAAVVARHTEARSRARSSTG